MNNIDIMACSLDYGNIIIGNNKTYEYEHLWAMKGSTFEWQRKGSGNNIYNKQRTVRIKIFDKFLRNSLKIHKSGPRLPILEKIS